MSDQDHLKRLRQLPAGSVVAIRRAEYTVGENYGPRGPHARVEIGLLGKKGAAYMLWLPSDARYVARFAPARGMGRRGSTRDVGVGDIEIIDNPGRPMKGTKGATLHLVKTEIAGSSGWLVVERPRGYKPPTPAAGALVTLPGEKSYWRSLDAALQALARHGLKRVAGSTKLKKQKTPSRKMPKIERMKMAAIKRRQRDYAKKKGRADWFEPGAMRFFNTKLHGDGYVTLKGTYFVASNQFDWVDRKTGERHYDDRFYYIVRQNPDGSLDTLGGPGLKGAAVTKEDSFPTAQAARDFILKRWFK